MAVAPLALAGLAMSAAGMGLNYFQKKKADSRADSILKASEKRVDKNSQLANSLWQDTAGKTTMEQQLADKATNADKRMGEYENASADAGNVALVPQEDAPQVVKTETAHQLGTQLTKARELMQARAQISGWGDTMLNNKYAIDASGRKIGQLGNFSMGDANAAGIDAEATRNDKGLPIGDILQAAGAVTGMAGGGINLAGAPAAAASTGAQGAELLGTGSSVMTQAPGWLARNANWLTKPLNIWG